MIPPRTASFSSFGAGRPYGGMPGRAVSFSGGPGGPVGYGGAAPGDCMDGGPNAALAYVGPGQGEFVQRTTFEYVGAGGDYAAVPQRRGFNCVLCLPLAGCLLLPLLWWSLSHIWGGGRGLGGRYDCFSSSGSWGQEQQRWCCKHVPDLPVCLGIPDRSSFPHGQYPTPEQCQRTNWDMDPWYDAFQQYCCAAQREGCGAARTYKNNPDCFYNYNTHRECRDFHHRDDGKSWVMEEECRAKDWVQQQWSENFQGYCCATYGFGCDAVWQDWNDPVCKQLPEHQAQCPADQKCYEQDWVGSEWSFDFRAHCCRVQQAGCSAVRNQNNEPTGPWNTPSA